MEAREAAGEPRPPPPLDWARCRALRVPVLAAILIREAAPAGPTGVEVARKEAENNADTMVHEVGHVLGLGDEEVPE
jgi:hypothetical protein